MAQGGVILSYVGRACLRAPQRTAGLAGPPYILSGVEAVRRLRGSNGSPMLGGGTRS
jgi:hypothetical protein